MRISRWLITAAFSFLLAGCATQAKVGGLPQAKSEWPSAMAAQRAAELGPMRKWALKGRLGVQLPSDGLSAGLEWHQDGESYEIKLFDQLGRQVALLQGSAKHVSLTTSKGESFKGNDAEKLLQTHLGWTIPVKSLFFWVRGLPDPKTVAWREDYNDAGHLAALSQGGWSVSLSRYSSTEITALPQLARVERESIKLKLLVKEWLY